MTNRHSLLHRGPLLFAGLVFCFACSAEDSSFAGRDDGKGRYLPHATGGGSADEQGLGGQEPGAHETPDCPSSACSSRSTCHADGASFECECLAGFEGIDCRDTDECAASACNGPCTNLPGTFLCDCPAEQIEVNGQCQVLDPCQNDSPCAPQAACEAEGDELCTCAGSTFGDGYFCKDAPDCTADSCSQAGQCLETAAGYVCNCESGYRGGTSCTACTTLELPTELEQHLRKMLGKHDGPLLPGDAAHLDTLVARDLGLTTLEGIDCLPQLQRIDLSGNRLNSAALSPLANLTRLQELRLDCNDIETLDALANHPSLRVLSVAQVGPACGKKLENLSALSTLKALRSLDLSNQALESLDELTPLRALGTLILDDNHLDNSAAITLGERPNLRVLSLAKNRLDSLGFAENMPMLRELNISSNELRDFSALKSAPHIEIVHAANTHRDITKALSQLKALRKVDLSNNAIDELNQLLQLPRLHWINLRSNSLVSAMPFLSHGHLHTVLVDNNPLRCDDAHWQEEESTLEALRERGTFVYATCTE